MFLRAELTEMLSFDTCRLLVKAKLHPVRSVGDLLYYGGVAHGSGVEKFFVRRSRENVLLRRTEEEMSR